MSPINETRKQFRAGPNGACEAHLFAFSRFHEQDDAPEEPSRLIAAVSLLEAVRFLKADAPDFRIRAVEHRGIIILLSGSPFA